MSADNMIPFPQRQPPPYDEVLYKHYGVRREPLTRYEQSRPLEAMELSRQLGRHVSYEEALCRFWGGI